MKTVLSTLRTLKNNKKLLTLPMGLKAQSWKGTCKPHCGHTSGTWSSIQLEEYLTLDHTFFLNDPRISKKSIPNLLETTFLPQILELEYLLTLQFGKLCKVFFIKVPLVFIRFKKHYFQNRFLFWDHVSC